MSPDPVDRLEWNRVFAQGFAGRPGANPGQPFKPGAISGGLNAPLVEATSPADGGPGSHKAKVAASDRSPGRAPGYPYVAPEVDTAGLQVIANWAPDARANPDTRANQER